MDPRWSGAGPETTRTAIVDADAAQADLDMIHDRGVTVEIAGRG